MRELREAAGLSQAQLAERLDEVGEFGSWSQALISGLEIGTRRLKVDQLLDLCAVFRVTPNEFLGFEASLLHNSLLEDAVLGKAIRDLVTRDVAANQTND